MNNKNLMQGVEFSHWILRNYLEKDDIVVDATIGNGYDTLFLANIVGENGKIFGFDIQKSAIETTKKRLKENDLNSRVELIYDGHENLNKYINDKILDVILFNLGYLPGSNKEIITKAETTIKAIKSGLLFLKKNGLIILVIYPGHEGGKKEKNAILDFCKNLNRKNYNVLHYHYLNQNNKPPEVLIIRKRK